ncbi:transposase [Candidatus Synechococcus calcipolaris G9]|uniref:Transposase n=1 Tax=Candidatus Synechococcus calcipolaris G9 TaxID=1497997 RepID=A0ABT6ETQ9_9SYNE|nr:transposase [Candidatus Synechococcus calcipolaris]MDG2989325.1 transposase [Candidatus Synechococcus calcipolaris G9]
MIKMMGIDISRCRASVCLINELPDEPLDWFRQNRDKIIDIYPNREGIEQLLNLGPTHVALEPTGIHYSKIWVNYLSQMGAEILWVGHSQLCSTRKSFRLSGKNDHADALALACYGLQKLDKPKWFLNFDLYSEAYKLRQVCLEINHLERRSVPIMNRIRQQLSHEWPEMAQSRSRGPLWFWIAGEPAKSKRTETIYTRDLAHSIGMGLSDFTRFQAMQWVEIEKRLNRLDAELVELLKNPDYILYRQAMGPFNFSLRIESILLAHIYPFENFLNADGSEIIEWVKGSKGQRSKRNRSQKAFKLFIGIGKVEKSSGESTEWVKGGSKLCRSALWQYIHTMIEIRSHRPKNAIGEELGALCDELKSYRLHGREIQARLYCRTANLLYKAVLSTLRK